MNFEMDRDVDVKDDNEWMNLWKFQGCFTFNGGTFLLVLTINAWMGYVVCS